MFAGFRRFNMTSHRFISLLLIIVSAFAFSFAQTSGGATDEKQTQQIALLEQIAKDAEGLRVAESRAIVAAKLGEGFWRYDEKRAREFFQRSISDLIAAQTEAEANKKQAGSLYGLINGTSPRQEILTMIASRDAAFALDAFYKSRPERIAQALADTAEKKKGEIQQYAQNEIAFEQTLINRLSEQDPQRALKLLRQSLDRGVTYESIALIEKYKTKDLDIANQIAAEVGDKLLSADFEKDSQSFSLAAGFVTEYGKKPEPDEKPVKVDDRILRDLTAKIARMILKGGDEDSYDIESLLPIIEQYSPENLSALRQKKAKYDKDNKREEYDAYSKFMESNPSPEKLVSEAAKFSDEFKNQIYYAAAEKSAQNGNVAQARKIIQSKLPEEESENYLSQINNSIIQQLIGEGKYGEANALINQIPLDSNRFYFLIQLATTMYQKNPAENKKQALTVLDQARALVPQPAETIEDLSFLMMIAGTLAEIEPEQSFQVAESLTYPVNEFVEASAIVGKYRNDGSVRQGEMLVNSYGTISGIFSLNPILTTLQKNDFKRTLTFVNGFQRLEVRISLEMQLIDNSPTDKSVTSAMPIGITSNPNKR